jgi:ubiquinone/menaquinone biosynthesis C-methylase UbiE
MRQVQEMDIIDEKHKAKEKKQAKDQKKPQASRWSRRLPASLSPIRSMFEPPQRLIKPYVTNGQMVADLGCGSGYYTLAMAQCVGPGGRVYAVDLDKKCIRTLEKKMNKEGYHNIEVHALSASELGFIKNGSVDFVLANGLLCSMANHRKEAVNEIKRILKPGGQAFLSLGFPYPIGFVNRVEWEKILEGFRVERSGGIFQRWAIVSVKKRAQ